jgi:Arc/MetJ family transcription regulator
MTENEMNRRRFVVGGSASAVALTMAGLAAQRAVNAQDATPTPSTGTEPPATTDGETTNRYDAFVAALATALGSGDAATVDAAIRTALKQMVDDKFAAGNISANEATARKEQIDTAESPLGGFGFGGHGGKGGIRGGRNDARGGQNDGQPGGSDESDGTGSDETAPETEATPDAI